MFFQFTKYVEEGPTGKSLTISIPEESSAVLIGELSGKQIGYVDASEFDTLKETQPEEINFKNITLSKEQKEELKRQRVVQLKKDSLREKLTVEVGDLYDMVADCMKLIELNIMLTSRLAGDYFETAPLSPEVKEAYKNRNQDFLSAVDTGHVTLRADFENPSDMLLRLMTRYSKINDVVKVAYADELKKIGL